MGWYCRPDGPSGSRGQDGLWRRDDLPSSSSSSSTRVGSTSRVASFDASKTVDLGWMPPPRGTSPVRQRRSSSGRDEGGMSGGSGARRPSHGQPASPTATMTAQAPPPVAPRPFRSRFSKAYSPIRDQPVLPPPPKRRAPSPTPPPPPPPIESAPPTPPSLALLSRPPTPPPAPQFEDWTPNPPRPRFQHKRSGAPDPRLDSLGNPFTPRNSPRVYRELRLLPEWEVSLLV